jgi:hypothetical protein
MKKPSIINHTLPDEPTGFFLCTIEHIAPANDATYWVFEVNTLFGQWTFELPATHADTQQDFVGNEYWLRTRRKRIDGNLTACVSGLVAA